MNYRGWANFETWAVNNWYGTSITDLGLTATQIRSFVEEQITISMQASLQTDLVLNSLARVSWEELAEAYQPEEILYDEC